MAIVGGESASSAARAAGDAGFPVTHLTLPDGDGVAEAVHESDVICLSISPSFGQATSEMGHVERACLQMAPRLRTGQAVVVASTVYPGTTEDIVRPILESSGLVSGSDFLLAYSPDRMEPGEDGVEFRTVPRIVGGVTPEATGATALFYSQLVDKVISVSSSRAAELTRLLEKGFRHVNMALANEMAVLCHEMEIDVWEVIDAVASKPFGFLPFYPGPVEGGDGEGVDPGYLAWRVRRRAGQGFRMFEQAQDVNAQMPGYVASRIGDSLNEAGKPVKGATIFFLGVTHGPDVGEIQGSSAVRVLQRLQYRGARVAFNDPYVDSIPLAGGRLHRTELTQHAVRTADCVAILAPHSSYDLDWLADNCGLIFDGTNAFGPARRPNVVRL